YDAKGLIKAAIRDEDPVLFFEHKLLYRSPKIKQEVPADDYIVPIGKASVRRQGRDLSIITYGATVYTALDAAERLKGEDIDAEVIDLRTLMPFDREAIVESVKKTSKVIILHEATRTGGMAGELTAVINEDAFEYLDAPVMRVTSIDTPVPYAPPLEEFFLPQVDDVIKAARTLAAY
ncbi:MAG TPA: transketolase C-terminal domain-containing protein, partial [Blastocatellia bacterium]|nr:transketolase C-terminal domain-containing protein [Blastocatellia bacterium]